MHTKVMEDSEGTFQKPEQSFRECKKCGKNTVICETWESSCGGYEDYKYTCQDFKCNFHWWIDGIDS